MSWLSDLAGKAEDFLNKVDQSAAVAFQNENKSPSKNVVGYNKAALAAFGPQKSGNTLPSHSISNQHSSSLTSPERKSKSLSSSAPGLKKSIKLHDEDEKLFEFLNGSDEVSLQSKKDNIKAFQDNSSTAESKNSSFSGNSSIKKNDILNDEVVDLQNSELKASDTQEMQASPLSAEPEKLELSSLEVENQWLRNELSSVNQDMVQVLQRSKNAEAELKRLKEKFDHYNAQANQSDHVIKELQSREIDLNEALSAKDSQLAILRVRLQEADKELQLKRDLVKQLEQDKSRILVDHNDSSDLQNQALITLRDKSEETERTLESERSQFKIMQNEHLKRLSRMEEDQTQLSANVAETQKLLSEERSRNLELSTQLRSSM